MIDWLLSTDGFVPRKSCGAWTRDLIWLHTGSDLLIWLAYLSIPCALIYFTGQKRLGRLNRIVWLFAAFILCCGFTHLVEALMFEKPLYHLSGVMKALTAVVSWITVLALIPSIPKLIPALTRLGESSREMPALGALLLDAPPAETNRLRQFLVAALAATFAVLVRGLFDPIMAGDHAFVIPLLAVVFVSWHSGFWPGILTLFCSMVAVIYFFIDEKYTFVVTRFSDQLAVGFFLFAGLGCALLGQAQLNNRSRAAKSLSAAEAKQRELMASEASFRSLAEAMPQIVWVARPDGLLEYINPNWSQYSGSSEAESLGVGWLGAVHPEDRGYSERRWKQSIGTGEAFEVTYRLRGADGAYRWFLGRALPQRDESGTILRWFGTCTDIDDAKRTEADLKESRMLLQQSHGELEQRVAVRTSELSEAVSALQDEVDFRRRAEERAEASALELRRNNSELEQFAYVASHDLQEPLRKIQAFGDRLKVKCAPNLGPDGTDYLERMLNSSTRMRQLINDLLAYSRVSSTTRTFLPISLNAIAAGVLSDLEIRIQQTGARVTIGELPTIDADPLQMRQLFQNLIGNALKFAKADQPPTVTVEATILPGARPMCQLQFRDDGIGFDEKYLDRIFQVFQRLHGRGEYEGTGVGLAICHKIAHLHDGEITARSRPGQGATFFVTLPMRHTPTPADTNAE